MKMSIWSLACQKSALQRYHSAKHLSEFYPQNGGESQLASKLRHCHAMYSAFTVNHRVRLMLLRLSGREYEVSFSRRCLLISKTKTAQPPCSEKIDVPPKKSTPADIGSFACREPMISELVSRTRFPSIQSPAGVMFLPGFLLVMYAVHCSGFDNIVAS